MTVSKFVPDFSYQAVIQQMGSLQEPEICSGDLEPGAQEVTIALDANPTPENLQSLRQQHPEYQLRHGGRINWTALAVAIDKGAIPLIRYILNEDPDLVNGGWRHKEPYLHTAVKIQDGDLSLKIVKELLSRGARVNIANASGRTALCLSLMRQETHEKVTQFLLKKGGVIYKPTIFKSDKLPICFYESNGRWLGYEECTLAEVNPYRKMEECFRYRMSVEILNKTMDVLRVPSILMNGHLYSKEVERSTELRYSVDKQFPKKWNARQQFPIISLPLEIRLCICDCIGEWDRDKLLAALKKRATSQLALEPLSKL